MWLWMFMRIKAVWVCGSGSCTEGAPRPCQCLHFHMGSLARNDIGAWDLGAALRVNTLTMLE